MIFLRKLKFSKIASLRRNSTSAVGETIKIRYLDNEYKGVVEFCLNYEAKRNAFSKELVKSFFSAIDEVKYNRNIRTLIIRSLIPKIFCAGADLKERLNMSNEEVREFVTSLRNLMSAIENLEFPVVAAIDGAALGGGLEIALACDIRTASRTAKLGLVETKLAIFPAAGGSQRLPRLIGPSKAKELIFTSKVLDGQEAYNFGIVNHVVEPNDSNTAAYKKALEIAKSILPNGPLGIKWGKMAINEGLKVSLESGLAIEEAFYSRLLPTKDRIEGLKAFIEKRSPNYKGE